MKKKQQITPSKKSSKRKNKSFFLLHKKSIIIISIALLIGVFGASIWNISHNFFRSPIIECANTLTCLGDLSGQISQRLNGTYMGKSVTSPDANYFEQHISSTAVLGAATGPKHIMVDLSAQRLYAYQGNALLFNYPVATGKWNLTPTGTFAVWVKLQATLMAGGSGGDSYYLPNVPWTMYFYNAKIPKNAGYSLHGKYWDSIYGTPDSHGCVNMRISDAKSLYDWIDPPTTGYTTYSSAGNPGTLVTIYGTTPNAGLVGTRFYNNNVSFDAGSAL